MSDSPRLHLKPAPSDRTDFDIPPPTTQAIQRPGRLAAAAHATFPHHVRTAAMELHPSRLRPAGQHRRTRRDAAHLLAQDDWHAAVQNKVPYQQQRRRRQPRLEHPHGFRTPTKPREHSRGRSKLHGRLR